MVSAPPPTFLGGPNSFEGSYFWGDLQKSKKDGGTCSFWGDLKIFHYGGTYYSVVSLFSVMLRLFVIVIIFSLSYLLRLFQVLLYTWANPCFGTP